MSLTAANISSMNYLFMQYVTRKTGINSPNEEHIMKELSSFIQDLVAEHKNLDSDTLNAIQTELLEGEHLYGRPIQQIRHMLDDATERITGAVIPEVSQFYTDLIIKRQRKYGGR